VRGLRDRCDGPYIVTDGSVLVPGASCVAVIDWCRAAERRSVSHSCERRLEPRVLEISVDEDGRVWVCINPPTVTEEFHVCAH